MAVGLLLDNGAPLDKANTVSRLQNTMTTKTFVPGYFQISGWDFKQDFFLGGNSMGVRHAKPRGGSGGIPYLESFEN